jgi:hypothetical protein
VRVTVGTALQAAASLVNFDGDSLSLAALDAGSGLYVDRYEEHSKWFVEFVVWGEWAAQITPIFAA